MKGSSPVVELTLPVLPDMELAATKTAEVVAKHMDLSDEKSAEISMALIEACINAFEHSGTNKKIELLKNEGILIKDGKVINLESKLYRFN